MNWRLSLFLPIFVISCEDKIITDAPSPLQDLIQIGRQDDVNEKVEFDFGPKTRVCLLGVLLRSNDGLQIPRKFDDQQRMFIAVANQYEFLKAANLVDVRLSQVAERTIPLDAYSVHMGTSRIHCNSSSDIFVLQVVNLIYGMQKYRITIRAAQGGESTSLRLMGHSKGSNSESAKLLNADEVCCEPELSINYDLARLTSDLMKNVTIRGKLK